MLSSNHKTSTVPEIKKDVSIEPKSDAIQNHIPVLDGIRGIAILIVMLFHQTILTTDTMVDRIVMRVLQFGWCGVDLFFVLSGFLITTILLDTKGSHHYLRNFYARRVLRIFPLYYTLLIICFGVLPLFPHPKADKFARITGDEIWYFFYLQNYIIANHSEFRHGILDVTWSLAIEEQFYLVWPLLVLILRPRSIMWLCIAVLGGALALRIAAFEIGMSPVAVYVATPTRLDGLASGAFAALVVKVPMWRARLLPYIRIAAVLFGFGLLGIWTTHDGYSWESYLTATLGYSLLAVFFASVLLLAVRATSKDIIHKVLTHPILIAFGKYSYSMYLFHLPVRAFIRDVFFGSSQFTIIAGSQLPGQLVFYLVSISITFAISFVCWHLLEKQFLKMKSYFPHENYPRCPNKSLCRGQPEPDHAVVERATVSGSDGTAG